MSDAANYARVFRAASHGVMRPFGMGQQFGNQGAQGGYISHSFSTESYDKARSIQGAFEAIAEVFEKIAEAEATESTSKA